MRTLKEITYIGFFTSKTDGWASLSRGFDTLHKILYEGRYVYFDGYKLYEDNEGDILTPSNNQYSTYRLLQRGDKFKLISVVNNFGVENYLGKCVKTGNLITFSKEQITLR